MMRHCIARRTQKIPADSSQVADKAESVENGVAEIGGQSSRGRGTQRALPKHLWSFLCVYDLFVCMRLNKDVSRRSGQFFVELD